MNNHNQKSSAETLYQPFLIFYRTPQKQIAYFTSRLKQPCYQFAQMEINSISANSGFSIFTKLLLAGNRESTRPLFAEWEMGTKGAAPISCLHPLPHTSLDVRQPPSTSEVKPLLLCPCCPLELSPCPHLCAEVVVLCAGPQAVQVSLDPSVIGEATHLLWDALCSPGLGWTPAAHGGDENRPGLGACGALEHPLKHQLRWGGQA